MALERVDYNTIKYVFSSHDVTGSGFRLIAATDIPEGSIVKCDATGKAALCGAGDVPIGVARFPVAAGMNLTIEKYGNIKDYATSGAIALTVGGKAYAAAGGAVASTGTNQVGVAISPTEVIVSL